MTTLPTRADAANIYAAETCYQPENIPMVRSAYLVGAREEAARIAAQMPTAEAVEAAAIRMFVADPNGGIWEQDKRHYLVLAEAALSPKED